MHGKTQRNVIAVRDGLRVIHGHSQPAAVKSRREGSWQSCVCSGCGTWEAQSTYWMDGASFNVETACVSEKRPAITRNNVFAIMDEL